jgi:D-alanyl-D-alanine endopeptidase (penicillin-binding protein 7)
MYRILPVLAFLAFLCFGHEAIAQMRITASSWLVADGNGKIIQGENTKDVRSIASISKLVMAMIVLDAKQDLDEYIKPYSRKELLQLSIVHSDNRANDLLCNNYPGGKSSCVKALNDKARSLGLENTRFT